MRRTTMLYKTMWLFLWITLAFWAGCAAREHDLAGDHEPLYREGYMAADEGSVLPDQSEGGKNGTVEPSVEGAARTNWRPMLVAAGRGLVPHHPAYFGEENRGLGIDWRATQEHPTPLDRQGVIEHEADFATVGARARFDPAVIKDTKLDIAEFVVDLVTLPYQALRTPPSAIQWSPRGRR